MILYYILHVYIIIAISSALSTGVAIKTAAVRANQIRKKARKGTISWSTVQQYVKRSIIIQRHRRQTQKCGKTDPESKWSMARLAQCKQLKEQLALGDKISNNEEVIDPKFDPLYLHGIVFWDEKHKQCTIGHSSKFESRLCLDDDGNIALPADGGYFREYKPSFKVKYPKEARGLFGAAVKKDEDGNLIGVKCKPFNYTSKTIVGIKDFKENYEEAKNKLLKQKNKNGLKTDNDGKVITPNWESIVKDKVNKRLICITDLMDHTISESMRVYKGTDMEDKFFIFHDGLSLWWAKEAQEYIKSKGFKHRQIRCVGDTNKGNRYHNKIVGDSPEICRALDSHGFADLESSIAYHAAITSPYVKDNYSKAF